MDAALRRRITFSDHSLATDHVFSEVHLVTCRNVLIYFDHALQTRALRLFAEALVPRGFLGLVQFPELHAVGAASALPQGEARRVDVYDGMAVVADTAELDPGIADAPLMLAEQQVPRHLLAGIAVRFDARGFELRIEQEGQGE